MGLTVKGLVAVAATWVVLSANALEVTLTNDGRIVAPDNVDPAFSWEETPKQPGKDFDYYWNFGVYQTSTAPKPTTNGPNPTTYTFAGEGANWMSADCRLQSDYCEVSSATSRYAIMFSVDQDAILDLSVTFDIQGSTMRRYSVKIEEWEGAYGTRIYPFDFQSGQGQFSGPAEVNGSIPLQAGKEYSFYFSALPYNYEDEKTDTLISWNTSGSITAVADVDIDVLPGDEANVVYPNQTGKLPVVVLSADSFDATQVDPATLKFGSAEAGIAEPVVISNVDGQFGDDTTARFKVEESGIFCNDADVTLTGRTYSGEPFSGTDSIDATLCEDGGCHAY
jgi:hypothetical protein